jgi:hypothetical protein
MMSNLTKVVGSSMCDVAISLASAQSWSMVRQPLAIEQVSARSIDQVYCVRSSRVENRGDAQDLTSEE